MEASPAFKIMVMDDNVEIHYDFLKILTTNTAAELDKLRNELFDQDDSATELLPHFQIDTATQGQDGVKKITEAIEKGEPYSLAFVDIRMPPGWDGIETIKHIWEIDKDMQVVICTAYSDYSWEETISALGKSDNLLILKKPFDNVTVRQLAFALTRKWQLMQESRQYTASLEQKIKDRTQELQHQATHDKLTGLPNRILLEDRIKQAIATAERNKTTFSILFLDLDRFKLINDSLSHSAGDQLLKAIAERLKERLRSIDALARWGGDEFVILVTDIKHDDDAETVAKDLIEAMKEPYEIMGHQLLMTTSIGIANYPDDGDNGSKLLRNADLAMYQAKQHGANQYQHYVVSLDQENLNRLELEADLSLALERKQFTLLYQPEFDLGKNQIIALEALIRWNHPKLGTLLPMHFIQLAEETGLIVSIGEWMIREACRQNTEWQKKGLPPMRIAINIFAEQLQQKTFDEAVANILKEFNLDGKYLELELSENCFINNQHAIKTITSLKQLGVEITIDNFGGGSSTLNSLRSVSLNRLKLDESFVKNIKDNRGDQVLIQAILAMARSLNLGVMAEGVQNKEQVEFLKQQQCTELQGYFLSEPLTPEQLPEILKDPSKVLAKDK